MIPPENIPLQQIMIVLVVAAVVLFVGMDIMATVDSEATEAYLNHSQQWCQERGGELYNAQVIGSHGGLHCDLPNGTNIHMDNVVEVTAKVLEGEK